MAACQLLAIQVSGGKLEVALDMGETSFGTMVEGPSGEGRITRIMVEILTKDTHTVATLFMEDWISILLILVTSILRAGISSKWVLGDPGFLGDQQDLILTTWDLVGSVKEELQAHVALGEHQDRILTT